jgi:hypothetical protein
VQRVVTDGLIALAANPVATPEVRSRVEARLDGLKEMLGSDPGDGPADAAHRVSLAGDIERYQGRALPPSPQPDAAKNAPPGDPIG